MNLSEEEAVEVIHDFANRDVPPYVFVACLQVWGFCHLVSFVSTTDVYFLFFRT
jgi:hypothetical protein